MVDLCRTWRSRCPVDSYAAESERSGHRHPAGGQETSQITRFKKMEPRKYIHAAMTKRINPRNPPVKNLSLALTTNGIRSGRCSIFDALLAWRNQE